MNLEPAADPGRLYVARGEDVNPRRPVFTGDVFDAADLGVDAPGLMVVAHPCSFRGAGGSLATSVQVAPVFDHEPAPSHKWSSSFYNRMPLPGLPLRGRFHAARLDLLTLAATAELTPQRRIACLSHPGINLLQQRLVHHHTRLAVPPGHFQLAFDHTYEEADLLEEWATELTAIDDNPAQSFETWIREGDPSRQARLLRNEERAPIRRELRQRIAALLHDNG